LVSIFGLKILKFFVADSDPGSRDPVPFLILIRDRIIQIRNTVRVADPGSGAFLTPGSGMGRKSSSGSGIRDEQPGSYFQFFWDRDPGWRQFGSGIWDGDSSDPASGMGKSWIRDKYPGSATMFYILKMCVCAGDEYTWLEYARKPSRRDIGSRMLYRDAHMTGWAYKADSATS
jgi:hypothetical protein